MKRFALLMIWVNLSVILHAEAFPFNGVDSVKSDFFRDWYLTTDLSHYLDNYSDYVIYESETTGEWQLGDQMIFSISGNSYRQNKYMVNGMRVDSRFQVGSTLFHVDLRRMNYALDYHKGIMNFRDDSLQKQNISLTGNVGNLGGISPGTNALINLFQS